MSTSSWLTAHPKTALARYGVVALIAFTALVLLTQRANAAPLIGAEIDLSPSETGANSSAEVEFTTVSAVPTGGSVVITFPAGYDLTGPTTLDA